MDLQKLQSDLSEKGIFVKADSNGVVAGLIWGVEGIEKVPKLGDVLFYIVNGVRYGVKPKRGNKHDIEWYYKQLKMGMQGAKAYNTGLTQFLNTWIRKGELEVVFKGKATASTASTLPNNVDDRKAAIDAEDEDFSKFQNKVENIVFFGKKPFKVGKGTTEYGEWVYIGTDKPIYLKGNKAFPRKLAIALDIYLGENSDTVEKQILVYDPETERILFNDDDCSKGCNYYMYSRNRINFDKVYELLNKECAEITRLANSAEGAYTIEAASKKVKSSKVTADSDEQQAINQFKEDVEELTLNGKKAFNVKIDGSDVCVSLLVSKYDINLNEKRFNELVQDRLSILFPITKEWYDADGDATFQGKKKVGDITMYTEEWSSSQFADQLCISESKKDTEHFREQLNELYASLARDCSILNKYSSFKVVASPQLIGETAIDNILMSEYSLGMNKKTEQDKITWKARNLTVTYSELDGTASITSKGTLYANIKTAKEFREKLSNALSKVDDIFYEGSIDRFFLNELNLNVDKKHLTDGASYTYNNIYIRYYASERRADVFVNKKKVALVITLEELRNVLNKILAEDATADLNYPEVKETLADAEEENFEGIGTEHDRLMYIKVSFEQFLKLWRTSTIFNSTQLNKILRGFKLAYGVLENKFKNISIDFFYKKKDGRGYMRVEYKDELYIIYASKEEKTGDINVVTRKMKKNIPVKNFNILSTSIETLAYGNASLPPGFKKVWAEVSQST